MIGEFLKKKRKNCKNIFAIWKNCVSFFFRFVFFKCKKCTRDIKAKENPKKCAFFFHFCLYLYDFRNWKCIFSLFSINFEIERVFSAFLLFFCLNFEVDDAKKGTWRVSLKLSRIKYFSNFLENFEQKMEKVSKVQFMVWEKSQFRKVIDWKEILEILIYRFCMENKAYKQPPL